MKTAHIIEDIQASCAGLMSILAFFFGGMDGLFIALVVFMALDYISGVMAAVATKEVSSSVGFKGIFKKIMILMLVAGCHMIDTYVITQGSALRTLTAVFYIGNEGISILENAGRLGLPIPEKVKAVLKQLKEDANDEKLE